MRKWGVAERPRGQAGLDLNPSPVTFDELQQVSAPVETQFSGLQSGNTNTLPSRVAVRIQDGVYKCLMCYISPLSLPRLCGLRREISYLRITSIGSVPQIFTESLCKLVIAVLDTGIQTSDDH